MIYLNPGGTWESTFEANTPGLVGTVGVALKNAATGTVVTARTTSGIIEVAPAVYLATLTAPAATGDYVVVWDDGTSFATDDEIARVTSGPIGLALTTLTAAREFTQKNPANTEQDPVITNTIARASRVIQRKTRIFMPAETAVTKTFPYDGQGWLDLSPFYARNVTAVASANSGGTITTLTSTDWALRYVNPVTGKTEAPDDQVWTHLRAPKLIQQRAPLSTGVGSLAVSTATSRPDPIPGYGIASAYEYTAEEDYEALQTVSVTGDWGYTSVPADVEQACLITVKVWLSNYISAFTRTFNEDTTRVEIPEELPRVAADMLKPYLRTGAS